MPHWKSYTQLGWASRHLNGDEYAEIHRFYPGQELPEGEYVDAETGALVVVQSPGQRVPDDTVYIAAESLRDRGIMA